VDLGALLERARSAPPDRRIEWRDRIAVYGVRGIESVRPWLADPELAAFAIRVIERVGVSGEAHLASQVLRSARAIVPPGITGDVDWALKRLRPGAGWLWLATLGYPLTPTSRSAGDAVRSSAAGMASTGRAAPNRRPARTRIIRYHSIIRGEAPSAALAAQNRSAAAPSPIGIGPNESSEMPDGPEVSGEQTGE
jgi:hypothetical protein